jgi:hypothetical protein
MFTYDWKDFFFGLFQLVILVVTLTLTLFLSVCLFGWLMSLVSPLSLCS